MPRDYWEGVRLNSETISMCDEALSITNPFCVDNPTLGIPSNVVSPSPYSQSHFYQYALDKTAIVAQTDMAGKNVCEHDQLCTNSG